MNDYLFTISLEDVNSIAMDHIGRELTENEVARFKSKFAIEDWTDYVEITIDSIKEN